MCYKDHTTLINPIIDWTTDEVWEFIKEYKVPYCSLYDEGFKRLGCIGCPMGTVRQRMEEFERWPKYKHLYMLAFQKMIENRGGGAAAKRDDIPQTAEEYMQAYITEKFRKEHRGGNRLYPYGATRVADFSDMSPEEIMEWWIH